MRIILSLSLLFGSALAFPGSSVAADGPPVSMTADYIEVVDGVTSRGKYYASPEGIRIAGEIDGEPAITIVNFAKNVIWTVDEAERMYIEIPFEPTKTDDYTSPCADMKQNGELTSARRTGRDTVNGRQVEKWQCEGPDGVDTVWFDDHLKTEIRSLDHNGETFELRNIKEGRVSSDLFQPPAGYTRMAMPAMPGGSFPESRVSPIPEQNTSRGEEEKGVMEGLRSLWGR